MLSAFQASASMWDLILVLMAAGLGFFMKTYGWPRPPIIISIVMGDLIEKYYFLSATNYGWSLFSPSGRHHHAVVHRGHGDLHVTAAAAGKTGWRRGWSRR